MHQISIKFSSKIISVINISCIFIGGFTDIEGSWKKTNISNYHVLKLAKHSRIDSGTSVLI